MQRVFFLSENLIKDCVNFPNLALRAFDFWEGTRVLYSQLRKHLHESKEEELLFSCLESRLA